MKQEDFQLEEETEQEEEQESIGDLNLTLLVGGGIAIAALALILIVLVVIHPFSSKNENTASAPTESEAQTETVAVPDIVGMTETEAEAALSAVSLGIKYQSEEYSNEAQGVILRQEPEAGSKTKRNDTVLYVRSRGPAMLVLPSVSGMTLVDAKLALLDKGFSKIKTVYRRSNDAVGVVTSTKPSAEEKLEATKEVTLIVSTGKQTQNARPRDYRGMKLSEAAASASEQGLIADFVYGESDLVGPGEVMRQDIEPESSVASGSVLLLTISEKAPVQESGNEQTVTLERPGIYQGGAVRFVLEEKDGDRTSERLLAEVEHPEFPYDLHVSFSKKEHGALIRLYEKSGDIWSRSAAWTLP